MQHATPSVSPASQLLGAINRFPIRHPRTGT